MENTKIEEITLESQIVVDEYLSHYKDIRTYIGVLKKIPVYSNVTDFRNFTFKHFNYLRDRFKAVHSNVACIESFFQFMYCTDFLLHEDEFREYFQPKGKYTKYFSNKKKRLLEVKDEPRVEYKPSLSIKEIERLIKFCDSLEEVDNFQFYKYKRIAYTFQALFFDGISRGALHAMDALDFKNGQIKTTEGILDIPETYHSMFMYFIKRTNNTKFSCIDEYVDALGKAVEIEGLVPNTITKARSEYLSKCSQCGKEYLSFADNWKVVNGKIICNKCANNIMSQDEKKNIISDIEYFELDLLSVEETEKIIMATSSYDEMKKKIKVPCDFSEWNKYLTQIGELGETYVYEQEVNKLLQAGREDLADKVDKTIAKDHNNGYDILSYNIDGTKLHIEVKSTPGELEQPFYVTRNEVDKANQIRNDGGFYEIQRVYNIGKDTIGIKVYRDLASFELEDIAYKATLKTV